jgi:hypothetical protein
MFRSPNIGADYLFFKKTLTYFVKDNDLDIYINPTEENAAKMVNACVDYGIPGIVRIYLS